MKKAIFLTTLVAALLSCGKGEKFRVEGEIADASGKTLYLVHNGLMENTILDSVRLSDSGKFRFAHKHLPFPDFYRLVLDGKFIVFAIDSTETVTIISQYANFAMNYTINGEENNNIQQLRKTLNSIQLQLNNGQNIAAAVEQHKDSAKVLILKNARSMAAYFALHQQINGMLLFSPYDPADQKYYNAVANVFHSFMPDYERSKAIYSNALDAHSRKMEQQKQQQWAQIIREKGVGYIDIALPDRNGTVRKLSEFEGKTVLIDFSAVEMSESTDYMFALRDLYNKYAKRGFTIFQISLDNNRLLWEQATENLPWVCVRSESGANNSYISSYNIQQIPALFLLDKNGNLVSRIASLKTAGELIEKNL